MSANPRISVVIPILRPCPALPRLLSGLAAQRIDPADLEIRLADHTGRLGFEAAEHWRGLLEPARLEVDVGPPGSSTRTRLANRSLARCHGRTLLVLDPDDRVHPQALDRLDHALHQDDDPAGLAVGHCLRLGPLPGLPGNLVRAQEQTPGKLRECLRRADCVGPRPALAKRAWDAGIRYRFGRGLCNWDLGVQALEAGLAVARVRKTLTTVIQDPPMFRDQGEERGRAGLVTANPGFFAAPTLAWALAVLRREPWALCTTAGRIPGPREAERLRDRWVRRTFRPLRDYPEEVLAGLLSPAV